jgi:hypothetical protein
MFWEHFSEKRASEPTWSKRMSKFCGAVIMAFLAISAAWLWLPKAITIPYFFEQENCSGSREKGRFGCLLPGPKGQYERRHSPEQEYR